MHEKEMNSDLTHLKRSIDALTTRVDARTTQVDRRFEQIDQRFERIDQRFEQIDQRFEQIDQRFEVATVERRQLFILHEDMRATVALLAEGITTVDAKVDRLADRMDAGFEELRVTIAAAMGNHAGRIAELEGATETLGGRVRRLEAH